MSRFEIDIEALYVADYENSREYIDVPGFDVPVLLPKKPKRKHFKNYGLPIKEQKFKREDIPSDLRFWPKQAQDSFIEYMYHKREHGEWWLIGGREIYITGKAWTFFNFWYTFSGTLPIFRMEAVEFFWVWDYCDRDPECFGLFDIKPRRIGDTEKTLFLIWEQCAGTKYQRGGMQNVKDDAAHENFKRLVRSHSKMIWFFKPIVKGSDNPSKILEFTYPENKLTQKKLRKASKDGVTASSALLENMFKFPPIESSIDYEASVQGRYDGQQLGIYHMDEPGKILAFDIKSQWAVIRRTLALYNDRLIVGKALFTTTVEDYEKGNKKGETLSTITRIKEFWHKSNPLVRDGNGRTGTGLYRYFRSCVLSDSPDEFGFYDEEKTRTYVMNSRKGLEDASDWDGLAQLRRMQPLDIADVFMLPIDECVLMPVLLDNRMKQLDEGLAWNGRMPENNIPIKKKEIQGDLIWAGGRYGIEVEFIPNATGKWFISQFPTKKNNKIEMKGVLKPGNDAIYTFGVDPYDHMIEGKQGSNGTIHSMGGGAVYRKYDPMVDGSLQRDEDGNILESEVHKMQTDTFVCIYENRPQDPLEFYDDMLKTAIYYGVAMFYETDKPGVGNHFRNSRVNGRNFINWLKVRPIETVTEFGRRKKRLNQRGAKASAPVIQLYVDALKWHVLHRIHNYHHYKVLENYRTFKVHNRTECDLTVACGFALLAAGDITKQRIEEHRERGTKKLSDFKRYPR